MRVLFAVLLATLSLNALASEPVLDLPSCDLAVQRGLKGEVGGQISDAWRAHISMRANVLQSDIGTARKARRLTQPTADHLFERIEKVRADIAGFVKQQGFLSAAERASYDREFDAIAQQICQRPKR